MERILVGVDGSKASEAAVRWAGRLAAASDAQLVAFHAYRQPYAEVRPDEHDRMLTERAAILAGDWVRPAAEMGASVSTQLLEGDPRTELLARAASDDVDLLVLGRSGFGGGPGFLHLGSVVEYAAHHAQCPIAVISPDQDAPIHRIVVGVDGSQPATAAIQWSARLARITGAEIVAVTVAEPVLEWTPSWDEGNWRRDAVHDLEEWVAPLIEAGLEVDTMATENLHPADGLLHAAESRSADLLVLGTRGAGGFTGLRFGGVAMKVLHRAKLPLVLVPQSDLG